MTGLAASRARIDDSGCTRFCQRDKLFDGFRRQRRMHYQHYTAAGELSDDGKVLDRIVLELAVESWVDGVRRAYHQQRVAVSRRPRNQLGPDVATAARPIVDVDRRAPCLGE